MGRLFAVVSGTILCAGLMTMVATADDEEKPKKMTIKEVMGKAHKSKLVDKVADEKASDEERAELLDLYIALAENDPPKGDAKSWKILTSRLIVAAADAVEDPSDVRGLKMAKNCGRCHKAHKPS